MDPHPAIVTIRFKGLRGLGFRGLGLGTPHPVIVTTRDKRDYIRVLLYSHYRTITGWGALLRFKFKV